MISRSYPFHTLQARKFAEKDIRPERSLFESAGDRLCPETDQVQDTRVVSSSRVDMNRADLRYVLSKIVAPNGGLA